MMELFKRKRRPMKLLAPKQVDGDLQRIYHENAAKSPLLRLPPEVRNRIWYFLFGGMTIHIKADSSRGPIAHAVCRSPLRDEDLAQIINRLQHQSISKTGLPRIRIRTPSAAHKNCTWSGFNHRLSLSALRACRQLHQEAALFPYQHNTFSFNSLEYMIPFLNGLVLAQARAIEKITVYYIHDYGNKTFTQLLTRKLKGLKHINILVDCKWMARYYTIHDKEMWDTWIRSLSVFQNLQIVTASIAACESLDDTILLAWNEERLPDEFLFALAEHIEHTVMKSIG